MLSIFFFIAVSGVVSYIDIKKGLILDKIMFPSFFVLLLIKQFEGALDFDTLLAVVIVVVIFAIPVMLNMAFGGGDLRFGAFCALFLGLPAIGYFIIFSGLVHLLLLSILKKRSFAFAPAMSVGTLLAYILGNSI